MTDKIVTLFECEACGAGGAPCELIVTAGSEITTPRVKYCPVFRDKEPVWKEVGEDG